MKREYDYSISLIRFIAMCLIITCHFFQYFENELAWWLNVGVQLFLFISGYLYGIKKEKNNFIYKNFTKKLVPYYLLIVFMILIYFIACRNELTLLSIIKALLTIETIPGGEHLWFIKYILLCYLITPFIKTNLSKYDTDSKRRVLIIILTLFLLVIFNYFINSSFVFCYLLGLLYGMIFINNKKALNRFNYFAIFCAIFSNIIIIYLKYTQDLNIQNNLFYSLFCDFSHVLLGVGIFIILKNLFDYLYEKIFTKKIIDFLNYNCACFM